MPDTEPASSLSAILTRWAALVAPKPLVVLFDDVEVLQDQAMISFLRQLRGGFAMRGIGSFPVSVALVACGISGTMRSFSEKDVRALVAQHTTRRG
jgi:hypothetical protein